MLRYRCRPGGGDAGTLLLANGNEAVQFTAFCLSPPQENGSGRHYPGHGGDSAVIQPARHPARPPTNTRVQPRVTDPGPSDRRSSAKNTALIP
ncbi:hypothetical protein SKAU_G00318670 [Synaphobranchus kaupii]|uniref:Uncharacterized protein n=1 Tax=Synaphobranchus kaupii TaxID=118154 RepID=A0A9Q1ETC1_SYNKA|nr:hypothetical protein SKAU_G00318670 [Synaphobranchus kaupii]